MSKRGAFFMEYYSTDDVERSIEGALGHRQASHVALCLRVVWPGEIRGFLSQQREHEQSLHRRVHEPEGRVQRRARLIVMKGRIDSGIAGCSTRVCSD